MPAAQYLRWAGWTWSPLGGYFRGDAARRAGDDLPALDDAYSRGDFEGAMVDFDAAVEWSVHESVAPDATTYHGHEGVRRFWDAWAEAISGMELEIEECRSVGTQSRARDHTRPRTRSRQRRARGFRALRADRRLP